MSFSRIDVLCLTYTLKLVRWLVVLMIFSQKNSDKCTDYFDLFLSCASFPVNPMTTALKMIIIMIIILVIVLG